MYRKNPALITPNGNTIIWRYMGIEKFFHMITSRKLFFSRLSKMTDKYEGSLPDELVNKRLQEIAKSKEGDPFDIFHKERQNIERHKDYTFINCWTINRNESYALWKIYLSGSTNGVAIKSTVSKLRKSIEKAENNIDFHIGQVSYRNNTFDNYPPDSLLLATSKKPYYEFENELRVIYSYDPEVEKKHPIYSLFNGWEVSIDIYELIDSIYISPFVGSWFHNSFKEVIKRVDSKFTRKIVSSKIKDK